MGIAVLTSGNNMAPRPALVRLSRHVPAFVCLLGMIVIRPVYLNAQNSPSPEQPSQTQNAEVQRGKQALEFSDLPDFKIAGITDWTAVGGHGSDATLRTSEDLARDSSALHRQALPDGTKTTVVLDRAQEARLRNSLAKAPRNYFLNHQLGELYLQSGSFLEAVPVLKTALALHGNAADDEYALAQACAGVGDLKEARRHIGAAIDKDDNAKSQRFAGELDERLGMSLRALEEDQRAAQLDPSEENYIALASELLLHRAIWQAAELLAKGSQLYPHSSRMRAEWGAALFAGARYDEAVQRLCEASDLDPASREPYVLLGKAVLGSPAPLACATEALGRFVRLRPDDAEANFYLAMQLLKSHGESSSERATPLLKRAITLNPRYADAYVQLGILAAAAHQEDDALHYFSRAIAANPQQAEAHYRLGMLYERDGRRTEARQEFDTHEILAKQQADAVEQERRQVKEFVVAPQTTAAAVPKP